jgi:hypothetical protein
MAAITAAARDASAELRRVDLADGVTQVAEAYLRGANDERSPVELVVTVPASALTGPGDDITDMGDLADTPITPTTARRLACDAGVVALAVDESGQTVDVGRRRRTIPAPIKRALLHRDGGCRFPGCSNKLFTHGHHIEHWADGGKTALPNLVTLCSRHHRFVHEHGWRVSMSADQQPTFHAPDGKPVRLQRPALLPWNPPDLTPATPAWSGGAVDYNTCLEALEWRDRPPG